MMTSLRRWCRSGLLQLLALTLAPWVAGAVATRAVAAQEDKAKPIVVANDVKFDELAEELRKVLDAQEPVRKYREEHPAVVFRVTQATPSSPIRRVGIRLHGNEVGYVMIQSGRLRNGQLGNHRLSPGRTPAQPGGRDSGDRESGAEPALPDRSALDLAALQADADALAAQAAGRPRKVVLSRSGRMLMASIDDARPFNLGRILRVNNAEMAPPDWKNRLNERLTTRAAMPPPTPPATTPPASALDEPQEAPAMASPPDEGEDEREQPSHEPQAPPTTTPAATATQATQAAAKVTEAPAPPLRAEPERPALVSREPPVVREERSAPEPRAQEPQGWLPMTGGTALMWVAMVLVLALTLRTDALLSWRTLDGMALAVSCPLLLARDMEHAWLDGVAGFPGRWWAYSGLTLIALYWAARGVVLMKARRIREFGANVSPGAMLVIVLFALGIAGARVVQAPLSPASLDGILGGRYVADHGRLPYGQTPGADRQSPLLYVLHGAAARVFPTYVELGGNRVPPQWSTRDAWQTPGWESSLDRRAAIAVNALLALMVIAGLVQIGRRLNSTPVGLTLAAAFCVFPGAVESLAQPDVMLPAALLTWTIALALIPGVGGLLATLCAILAGLAWPWAWLTVPVLLVYFLRSGVGGAGAVLGVLGGVAGALAGLVALTVPALPRADGSLAAAGVAPQFDADYVEGQVLLKRSKPAPGGESSWISRIKSAVWLRLVDDVTPMTIAPAGVSLPTGVSPRDVMFCRLACDEESRLRLGAVYREAIAGANALQRMQSALRTVLEAVWMPADVRPADVVPAWNVFAAGREGGARAAVLPPAWVNYRRLAKIGVVLLAGALTVIAAADRRRSPVQLVGAMLAVTATAALASPTGAVASVALLAAAVLPLFAVHCDDLPAVRGRALLPPRPPSTSQPSPERGERIPTAPRGSMPRITVEN